MSVRKYWGAAATLAILTITNNVYAVDKQVSPAMKKENAGNLFGRKESTRWMASFSSYSRSAALVEYGFVPNER